MLYNIGWNMPGYLPEMEPYTCDTAEDAKRAMIDELLRHADVLDDSDRPDVANQCAFAMEDLNLSDVSQGWDATIGNYAYWITPVPFTESEDA